jgi:hypothetical protein
MQWQRVGLAARVYWKAATKLRRMSRGLAQKQPQKALPVTTEHDMHTSLDCTPW